MFPGRFTSGHGGQSSVVRKSKADGVRPSMLPKPRRAGSTDRASTEMRRPSTSYRSSSAEPARATLAGGRLSREASASKVPLNRRSKSQQAERFGQSSMTPLRSSQYARTTTTPVRTPSEDRQSRSWQACLDRALAFVTVKDQRPISNSMWQRTEYARVLEALGARGVAGASGGQALTRPLTITQFVNVCGDLLSAILRDTKLNNDNYIAKLPNLGKRFLYPGQVSKSWLKTVNTLHAFPHALAFIAFFLDLVSHIETPVSDEWLYVEKDELACLRRDFLYKSWIRFQDPGAEFEDLDAEYLQQLKQLLGHGEDQVQQLQETIQQCQAALEDESELAARAEEERLRARRDALLARVKQVRGERRAIRAELDAQRARKDEQQSVMRSLDADINNITAEIQQLKQELETQEITVAERAKLLDQVDYATRVIDSKRTLADQEITVAERAKLLDQVDYATRVIDSKRTLADQVSKEITVAERAKLLDQVDYATRVIDSKRTLADQVSKRSAPSCWTRWTTPPGSSTPSAPWLTRSPRSVDELQQLKQELETQEITVAERAKLLDQVDYATRVIDSKRTLADQVSKIMMSKETELAVWQKRTLDSCVEYKQALIHLAARFPPLAALAVDEQELMEASCAEAVSRAVDTLRAHAHQLSERRAEHTRARAKHTREMQHQLVCSEFITLSTFVS
ncbi:hypothetical protein O0L34_g6739 [Tuta absoluta]|nr:hypothetical protein O0L34_g6739 [Tuta absoluta]